MGGVNVVSSDTWTIDYFRRVSSTFQIGLEYDFQPWFGIRIVGSGPMALYPANPYNEHQYTALLNYFQLGADAMFDLCNIAEYRHDRPVSPYLFLGAAANNRFKTVDMENYLGAAVRTGLGLNIRLTEVMKLAFEVQYNALGDKFNTIEDKGLFKAKWDDNEAALLGLQFDLNSRRRRAEEAEKEARIAAARAAQAAAAKATADKIAAARAADRAYSERLAAEKAAAAAAAEAARLAALAPPAPEIPELPEIPETLAENPVQQPVSAEPEIQEPVYAESEEAPAEEEIEAEVPQVEEIIPFAAFGFDIPADQRGKVQHIIDILNSYPNAVVTISGFADWGSESSMPGDDLSMLRLDSVLKAITNAGINFSRVTINNYGFSPQNYYSEHNRIVVCETQ